MRILGKKHLTIAPSRYDKNLDGSLPGIKNRRLGAARNFVYQEKPWGIEFRRVQSDDFDIWELQIKRAASTSFHIHSEKEAFVLVLEGTLELRLCRQTVRMAAGECRLLQKGVAHQLANTSTHSIRILEIESPPNRDDITRLDDPYGRAGFPYAHGGKARSKKTLPKILITPNIPKYQTSAGFCLSYETLHASRTGTAVHLCHALLGPASEKKALSLQREMIRDMLKAERLRSFLVLRGSVTLRGKTLAGVGDICIQVSTEEIFHLKSNTVLIAWRSSILA